MTATRHTIAKQRHIDLTETTQEHQAPAGWPERLWTDVQSGRISFRRAQAALGSAPTAVTCPNCPNCQAKPGEPCTQPTSTGRRPVSWYHSARTEAAAR